MKRLALICLLAFVPPSFAQCVNCGTPSVTLPAWATHGVIQSPEARTWSDGWFVHEDGHVELWRSGKLECWSRPGAVDWAATVAKIPSATRERFGLAIGECDCTCGCGCDQCSCGRSKTAAGAVPFWATHGVQRSPDKAEKFTPKEIYRLDGAEVTAEQALRRLGDPTVPDDAAKSRLVVVGSTARQKVLDDWSNAPELAPYRESTICQAYAPDDWAVKDVGYTQGSAAGADPTIYVVSSSGQVLHRQEGYHGPGPLAQALRRADPAYDPAKDPDLTKPKPVDPKKPDEKQKSDSVDASWVAGAAGISLGTVVLGGAAVAGVSALRRRNR